MKFLNIELSDSWRIQSSLKTTQTGEQISKALAISKDWHPATVPTTVLGTLVANKTVADPYFGDTLKTIPTEQFKVPWWYVTRFNLNEAQASLSGTLSFDGINYKANVWLNGHLIADITAIDGAYRRTAFQISDFIINGTNILAVEVFPPKPGDFSTGFVDWNPAPPDGNMGIFRPVTLKLYHGVRIENPFVQTRFVENDLKEALLTITADIHNDSDTSVAGFLRCTIEKVNFKVPVSLLPNSKKEIRLDPNEYPQLNFKDPRLWWPVHLGNPELYELALCFQTDQHISDATYTKFGIREVSDYWLHDTHRGFMVNGQKVLIKGAGWTDDLLLMDTHENIEAQVKYVKQMNLNCIRLEGFWGKDHKLYDLCDAHGILLMVGWSCHWEHEIHMGVPVDERFGGVYKTEDIDHISKAWEEQLIWLRNHPSIFVWTVASDKVPITALEQKYIETFAKHDPTRPYLNSTGGVGSDQHVIGSEDVISEISGSSGVKMLGPYAYTAPVYWFTDTKFGGAYGFNTETGPGAQPPQLDSLKKFIPKDKLWPISEIWDYHCGRYEFSNLDRFTTALNARYGAPDSIEEFDQKAQAMNYELMRPMFEAFQVNKKGSTGIIQWMLNAAWPKMYWQLYDYFLMPTGAFYATQKACAPLQLIYNYGDHQIYLVNDHLRDIKNLTARIRVFSIDSKIVFDEKVACDIPADGSHSIFKIAGLKNISATYFIDLRLYDSESNELNTNFYWLSTQEETLDYEADLGPFAFHTPSKQFADLTLLNQLPKVDLTLTYHFEKHQSEQCIFMNIENNSAAIAFLVNIKLTDKDEQAVLPVFWEENMFSLLPHEQKTIKATFKSNDFVEVSASCWNLKSIDYIKKYSTKVIA
ncbi:MAG: glycoside hydrolase family 2 TIM barrel-domain containing protein [Flavobacteriaceae bacterium]